jgi:peptidoglycan/LPS O-acetylase OafA/YrhL
VNKYRLDIDGLRAIAVIAVIFYHFEFPFFQSGFVGVDVFFVISGYLISSIIFNQFSRNEFSFLDFYKRRALRIFPALYCVLIISTLCAFFLYDSNTLYLFGKNLIATLVFASNFYFKKSVGYFTPLSQYLALLHTWSLAVEEQFYLLFPAVIFVIFKYFQSKLKFLIIFGFISSLILCLVLSQYERSQFSFYMLPTRAWEFLLGTMLAIRIFPNLSKLVHFQLLSLLGFVLLIVSTLFLTNLSYPSYQTVIPVSATALLIYSGEFSPQTTINKFLGNPVLVFIGKISYSLYLWHWVILAFYDYLVIGKISWTEKIFLLLIVFCISYLSWKFVEQPYRKNHNFSFKKTALVSFTVCLSLLIIGFGIYKTKGVKFHYNDAEILESINKDNAFSERVVRQQNKFISDPEKAILPFVLGNSANAESIIWGDSHAASLGVGLLENTKNNSSGIYLSTFGGFPPIQNTNKHFPKEWKTPPMWKVNAKVLEFIIQHKNLKTVILAARWPYNAGVINKYDSHPHNPLTSLKQNGANKTEFEVLSEGLKETVQKLKKANRKVIVVTDVPILESLPANYLTRVRLFGKKINDWTPNRSFYESNNKQVNEFFVKLKDEGLVDEILPLHEYFFDGDKTILEENGKFLYKDDDHLSYYGAMKVRGAFLKYMPTRQ